MLFAEPGNRLLTTFGLLQHIDDLLIAKLILFHTLPPLYARRI